MAKQNAINDLNEFHESIGALVVSFVGLETLVILFIVGLIKQDPNVTMALVSEMSFNKRLDALQSVAPFTIKDAALCHELNGIVAHLSKSEHQRNIIVHTTLLPSASGGIMSFKPTAKRKKGLQTNFSAISVQKIAAGREHITVSMTKLSAFISKLQNLGVLTVKICQ